MKAGECDEDSDLAFIVVARRSTITTSTNDPRDVKIKVLNRGDKYRIIISALILDMYYIFVGGEVLLARSVQESEECGRVTREEVGGADKEKDKKKTKRRNLNLKKILKMVLTNYRGIPETQFAIIQNLSGHPGVNCIFCEVLPDPLRHGRGALVRGGG